MSLSAGPLWKKNSPKTLQSLLEKKSKNKVQIKINDNRSTMLSVRFEPKMTKVSLHQMFLDAPSNIMDDLACYIGKEKKQISSEIRAFIETGSKKYDYSHAVNRKQLETKGKVFDLEEIYNEINQEYFKGKLDLLITWFGKEETKGKSKVTFGLFSETTKLIKVHRMLDNPLFPKYVIDFVVYHEMLHYVCPSYYDKKGVHRIHSKEFKAKEKEFRYYQMAEEWIKNHLEYLFHNI